MKMHKNKTLLFPVLAASFLLVACQNNNYSSHQTTSEIPSSSEASTTQSSSGHSSLEEHSSESLSSNVESPSSEGDVINVTGIELNYDSLSIEIDKKASLTYTIYPLEATNKNVIWSSDNEEVVTVNDGILEALKVGNATITVTTEDGSLTDTCEIKVIEKDSTSTYEPIEVDGVLMILEGGDYDITQNYKQIYVNAPECDVTLNLNGVTIENDENSPIYVASCNSIDISAKKGSTNYIKDTRDIYNEENDDGTQGKGAIYVEDGDLTLKGKGTLNLSSTYLNGIHGKDDVEIKNLTLDITSVNHAVRGNDSVTVTSGNINIVCGGDGFHSENSDISSKGNQRGNVTLNGGTITVNSWSDAVDAAYNAIIEEVDETVPLTFTAKTNKYSSYNGEVVETSSKYLYLKMNSTAYANGAYKYAAYINDSWCEATYIGTKTVESQQMGGRPGPQGGGASSTYYFYRIEKPTSSSSFKLYRFASNATISTSSYNAVSDLKAFNDNYDTVQISVSSSRISFSSWSNYSGGLAAKGIKADNEIYVKSGNVTINSYDDALHANNDSVLENGEKPLGNIYISGGTLSITAADDAVHADNILNISGGITNVSQAYEGLEANVIQITGGETYVLATDDGVNATKGNYTPSITVSGGLLDVAVPTSGDTDGIDSNGSYTQTGGVVIVKGPGSASGQMGGGAAALDTDGTVSISNGTLAVFGSIEKAPSYSVTRTLCSSSSLSGTKTISFSNGTSYTTNLKYTYGGCVVYSSLGTATLK